MKGDAIAWHRREERAERPAEQDNVVARVDWLRERVLVGVEAREDLGQNRVGILPSRGCGRTRSAWGRAGE